MRSTSIAQTPRQSRDNRIPTSVTVKTIKGVKYTVKIYDEEAYRANIAQYYPGTDEDNTTARPGSHPYTPRIYPKRKPQARYAWAKRNLGTSVHEQEHAG